MVNSSKGGCFLEINSQNTNALGALSRLSIAILHVDKFHAPLKH